MCQRCEWLVSTQVDLDSRSLYGMTHLKCVIETYLCKFIQLPCQKTDIIAKTDLPHPTPKIGATPEITPLPGLSRPSLYLSNLKYTVEVIYTNKYYISLYITSTYVYTYINLYVFRYLIIKCFFIYLEILMCDMCYV